jgi:hypothetical protein
MASTINGTSTGNGGLISTGDDSGILNIQTNETTAITVNASQNVGIGSTTPSAFGGFKTLAIGGDSGSSTSGVLQFINNGTEGLRIVEGSSAVEIIENKNIPMLFGTNAAERMRILSGGNVSIGTTSNIARIGAVFDGNTDNGCVLRTSTNASGTGFLYFQQDTNSCGSVIRVGTTSAVTYNSTSDHRLKENAIPLTNALETINKLKPITFNWIEDKSSAVGFLAHEFQEVIPLSVTGEKDAVDADGSPIYQQMDNSGSIPYLVKAIQELKAINDTQAETINALTARIVALEGQ